ncbi:MAG TPA: NrfD/PsrC family molybdoenzyme membrane anchor subunit [Candidatus Angelobacter sp.]|nr:NrfD/PsrC family molybdoenzyme membrane anchor subunit [Candidatus Angelobacter sp.]
MRYGFVIDQDRCIGCHACTVACKEEHQMPIGVFRTWVKYVEKGEFPHTTRHFGVMRCNHCDSAPCTTICPTHALFRRSDGIIDFDNNRCIGCKGCMQACPYDALYIDPNTNTAAKCNFCAHRVENKLEPACVIVCPTQAILAGDLDNPGSKVSRAIATQKVSVRKPQKGTDPKLFYVGIEGDLLHPTRLSHQSSYAFAEQHDNRHIDERRDPGFDPSVTREVYDVAHPVPWGWKIAAYLWTKSIASGVLMVATLLAGSVGPGFWLRVISPTIALVALILTGALLIFDLKRPDRFFYLLTKPNFRSWLVLGALILMAYGALAAAWLLGIFDMSEHHPLFSWPTMLTLFLSAASAGYSAFLFAQAKGRDLWQSPMFLWHLLLHALIAGSAILIIVGWFLGEFFLTEGAMVVLMLSMMVSLLMVLVEVALPHVSEDSTRAVAMLVRGRLRARFWGIVIGAGLVLPIVISISVLPSHSDKNFSMVLVALLALLGVWCFEDLWVKAGQAVPLS